MVLTIFTFQGSSLTINNMYIRVSHLSWSLEISVGCHLKSANDLHISLTKECYKQIVQYSIMCLLQNQATLSETFFYLMLSKRIISSDQGKWDTPYIIIFVLVSLSVGLVFIVIAQLIRNFLMWDFMTLHQYSEYLISQW